MRYVLARLEEDSRETTYRIFITKILNNGPLGTLPEYYDMIYGKMKNEDEEKTAEEIADDIIARAGLILR